MRFAPFQRGSRGANPDFGAARGARRKRRAVREELEEKTGERGAPEDKQGAL
jgi:hypothetical protein